MTGGTDVGAAGGRPPSRLPLKRSSAGDAPAAVRQSRSSKSSMYFSKFWRMLYEALVCPLRSMSSDLQTSCWEGVHASD